MTDKDERNLGTQPLDAILSGCGLVNSDLVEASSEQLTHKQVQKGRKGRRLTANIQRKILNALNSIADEQYSLKDLFNYEG